MCGLGKPYLFHRCVFGWFELGFVVCLEFVLFWIGCILWNKAKMPHLCFQPDASSPRPRSAHLGEGLFAYANSRPIFWPLSAPPRLRDASPRQALLLPIFCLFCFLFL